MKRPLTILAIIALSALIVYACGSTIPTGNTSFVTISIGGDSRTAKLHAEQATAWTRFKYFLVDAKIMPEAQAYVPSVVQVIVVTVSAADITTPIVGIDTLTPDQTSSTIRIEVPNGAARQFTVEGIRGINSKTYYRGTATADLDGTDVNLPVSMILVGPGLHVDFATGTDLPATSGTSTNPFKTITYALTRTSGTDAIYVAAGTYPPSGAAAGESYPLQLKPGTALMCTGTGFSTVLDLQATATTVIYGNNGASIDNCMVRVNAAAGGGIAINDAVGGQPLQQSRLRANGIYIELSGSPTGLANVGAVFFDDSFLLDSTVTGSAASGSIYGIQVRGGKPSIIGNTISNLPTGIDLAVNAGDAVIIGNMIQNNNGPGAGISIATSAKPAISANTISNNYTGIWIQAGDPVISGNRIDNNNVGIEASSAVGTPTIRQNSIFCSYYADLFSTATTTLIVANNSWDHDSTTVPPGPEEWNSVNGRFDCGFGADICYQNGPKPVSLPANAAVPGGCLFPSPN